ncbi:extracellular solute-binding protein, partial [Thioclava sp. BHET1]
DEMSNFKNMKPEDMDVYWDKGRHYSVPWQIGTTAFAGDTSKYKGDINSYAILFDPPAELKGKINMLDDMNSTMHAAERYLGLPRCGADKANLKKVNDLLLKAKADWKTFSYDTITKMTSGDVIVTQTWNGAAYRIRQKMPDVKYAYPKEGIEGWMDNVAVLKGAKNMDNAKLFQNFIMEPENAALISEFAGYNNGIKGSDKYLPADFASAPEITPPAGSPTPEYVPPCDPAVVKIYNQIWTNLRK